MIVTISCSVINYSPEQKNESCMALSNLLRETLRRRNDRRWFVPFSCTYSLKIFFIFIFGFKISSLGLKDCISSFIVTLENFFCTFLLCFPFASFFSFSDFLFFFYCLYSTFLFPIFAQF